MRNAINGRWPMRMVRAACAVMALFAAVLALGCANIWGPTTTSAAYTTYLYMTDTFNGHIYTYNPSTNTASSTSVLIAGGNGTTEIRFYKGIAYVANGYGGIYYFDPSATSPKAQVITGSTSLDAQYFAFYSANKAYVSVATTYPSGAVYWFNPSKPLAGLTQVASGQATGYMQEIIVGADGMIYVADNGNAKVLRIDPLTDTVTAIISATQTGTTGLFAGNYNSQAGVFIANTGGSIDFIANTESTATAVITNSTDAPIYPGRIIQLSNGNLVATGFDPSYASHTYLVELSGKSASVSEIKSSGTSFGSLSIAYNSSSGLLYVPSTNYKGTNKLYVFDESGDQKSYSPVSVMSSKDAIANVAFYQ